MKKDIILTLSFIFILVLSTNVLAERSAIAEQSPLTDFSPVENFSFSRDLFDLLYHFPVDYLGYSVATDGEYIYSSRWNGPEFYKYELDGTYVNEFTITGFAGEIRDLTYDGQYFYGSPNSGVIYILDLANATLEGQINTTVSNIRGIAYDSENDGFWVTQAWTGPLRLISRAGTTVETLTTTAVSISGLAWENVLDDGPYLWAYTQPTGTSRNILSQISLTTGNILQSFDLATTGIVPPPDPDERISGGIHITNQLVPGMWTFLGIIQNQLIWVLEMAPNGMELPFHEDFDDVVLGEIPAGWERSHVNWGVADSNEAGGEAPEMRFSWQPDATDIFRLRTPMMNITDHDEIYFSFDHMIEDYDGIGYVLAVEMSFDGENWSELWTVDPDGNIGPEYLDFTISDLADHDLICFAWVLYGDSLGIDYWYIDNVEVTSEPTIMPITLPYTQTFDDVSIGNIPMGWSSTHINWGVADSDNAGGEAPEMRFAYLPSAIDVFRLATSVIDITGLDSVYLTHLHMIDDWEGEGYTLKIQTSFDGDNWMDQWYIEPEGNIGPETLHLAIEDLEDEDELYIAWVVDGISENINYWYIDDILIDTEPVLLNPPQNLTYEVIDEIHVHLAWEEPEGDMLDEFRYDDGEVDAQLGFQGDNNSVMGAAHRVNAEIHEITWITTSEGGPHNTVNVFIFGLDAAGMPDRNNILYQEMNVPNVDNQWTVYELSAPVSAPDGFLIGLSYNGFLGLAVDDGIGAPWEFVANTQFGIFDYTDTAYNWTDIDFWGFQVNYLLRAYGYNYGDLNYSREHVALSSGNTGEMFTNSAGIRGISPQKEIIVGNTNTRGNRELLGYNVYRDGVMINDELVEVTQYIDPSVEAGIYTYYVTAVYELGESEPSNEVEVEMFVHVDGVVIAPYMTKLNNNYPNPFNPETTISFSLQEPGIVTLEVYNILGQKVRILVNEYREAGNHKIVWDGRGTGNREVSSGIYFYRMKSGDYTATRKMILMK